MAPHAGKIVINGAPSQYDRWLAALGAGYADVDGRSFMELLDFPQRFGRLINFYDLSDRVDGDWSDFFGRDPTMVLAAIATFDAARAEAHFLAQERRTIAARHERKFGLLCELFFDVMALARDVNRWLEASGRDPRSATARLLREQIVSAIERELGAELRRLVGYAEGAGLPEALGRRIPLDTAGFLPVWHLHGVCADGSIYRGRSRNRKIDHACPHVATVFFAFLDAISRLLAFARASFDASLEEADHPPQVALYIAFAKLFETAQGTINTLSERYVRFYYHDILREDFRPAVPDHVYLTFTLATDQGALSSTVSQGTLFFAGQDADGIDILYAADRSLLVTAAGIARLRTLRVVNGAIAGGPADEVSERVFGTEIMVAKPPPKEAEAWDTFGETEAGKTPEEITTLATLGFAIATPYLLLSGGNRVVALHLFYTQASADRLVLLLQRIGEATGVAPETVWRDVLGAAFTLSVSTADGWLAIDAYDVLLPRPGTEEPEFGLAFSLPSSAAAVAAYDPSAQAGPAVPGANPAPSQPTLRVYLRQEWVVIGPLDHQVTVYPLSLLGLVGLTRWEIATRVSELTDLELANTDGPIDPSKPFLPLGAPTTLGSFLEIRQPELFAKTLRSLSITINWFDLPQNEDGFKGWYRDYVIGLNGKRQDDLFDNRSFKVDIYVVNPITWELAAAAGSAESAGRADRRHYLFRTKSPDGGPPDCTDTFADLALCASTAFDDLPVKRVRPPSYPDPADSAIRLQLTAPPYAFGDDLYALNVLSAVIGDLPDSAGGPAAGPARCQDWKVLWDAAKWIGECMKNCATASPDDYKTCITTCLEGCMLRLVEAAAACALDCLTGAKDVRPDGRIEEMRGALLPPHPPSPTARAETMRQWIDRARADPALPSSLSGCLARCAMLLDAVLCIADCLVDAADQAPDKYKQAIEACLTVCMQQLEKPYEDCCKEIKYPNAPWVPQAIGVTLDYEARCVSTDGDACGRFFHLMPFDGYQARPAASLLLPRFPLGNLYIGFSGLVPPQPLTLLFEMTAASAAGWSERPTAVTWSCLARDGWIDLTPAQIMADGTNGLQNSGILALNLPGFDPVSTVLDPDCQWLGASVADGPSLFPQTSRIEPHALLATWQDNGSVAHLSQPLPANTIASSVAPLPDIATIGQPMASFGGRAPETGRSFQTWLGERLRHKDRGILGWDYERLVLEQFPTVWKVQALPARGRLGATPGSVLLVVVPGPDSTEVLDPTAPVASADLLGRIGASLETMISPFVTLEVANPNYVRITVTAAVLFAEEQDPGAAIRRLNDDLLGYLSPWPYDAARAAKGGDYASPDEISEFIQTRPYVDALMDLGLAYDPDPATLDWYFLTSAKKHDITAVDGLSARRSRSQSAHAPAGGHPGLNGDA